MLGNTVGDGRAYRLVNVGVVCFCVLSLEARSIVVAIAELHVLELVDQVMFVMLAAARIIGRGAVAAV